MALISVLQLSEVTTLERDTTLSPAKAGMLIFNTDVGYVEVYDGAAWQPLGEDFSTLQEIYDNSADGNTNLSTNKHITYTATDAAFRPSSMSSAQFDAITTPPSGLLAWANDSNRVRLQKGAPGSPVYDELAYLSDVTNLSSVAGTGEMLLINNSIYTNMPVVTTPYKVLGTYTAGLLNGFTVAPNGTLTYAGPAVNQACTITAALSITMNLATADLEFSVYQNGAPAGKATQLHSVDGTTPSFQNLTISFLTQISNGDTFELYVTNNSNTDPVLVSTLNLKAFLLSDAVSGGVKTLATVVDPNVTNYAISTYSNMVNAWSGSPTVPALSLAIGETVEFKAWFNLDPSLIGTQPSLSGNFRFSFGNILTLGDQGGNLILTNNATRCGEATFSITRINANTIQANQRIYYTQTNINYTNPFPVQTPLTYSYDELVSNTMTLEWRPIVGSATEYMTCNLVNTRITKF
jgi:hypothetical protein